MPNEKVLESKKEQVANLVEALKAENMRVVCWGVFTDELGLAMAEAGVDAMTCNHAVALRQKFQEIKK